MKDLEKLLWISSDCRPSDSAATASTLAIGCTSGRLLIFRFPNDSNQVPQTDVDFNSSKTLMTRADRG